MTPRVVQATKYMRRQFIEKFGREPGPGDPVFFDPDSDVPRKRDSAEVTKEVVEAMKRAGIHPAHIFAYEKTGMFISESNLDLWPEESLDEYQAAIDEWTAKYADGA